VKRRRGRPLAQSKTTKPPKCDDTPPTVLSDDESEDIPLVLRRKMKKIDEYKDKEDEL
jgi:hypothetical protein